MSAFSKSTPFLASSKLSETNKKIYNCILPLNGYNENDIKQCISDIGSNDNTEDLLKMQTVNYAGTDMTILFLALVQKRYTIAEALVDLFIKHDKKDQLTFKINHSFYGGNVNNLYLSINGNCRRQYGVAIKLIKYFIKEKMTEELIVSDQMKLTLLIHVLHAQLYDEANDLIDYFIENDKEQLTKFDVRGYTVLIHAIASGDERKKTEKEKVILKLIDYFVENDKEQLTKNINGVSVLKEANDNKLSKVINTLIKYYTENNMISELQNTDQEIVQKHLSQSGGKTQIKMYQKRNKNRKHTTQKKRKHIKTKNTKSIRRRITKKTI